MKNNYYNLTTVTGKSIIETRQQVLDDDRVINPRYYDIDIDPNKTYLASIIYEDIWRYIRSNIHIHRRNN